MCVCVSTSGFGSISHRGKKTENIAQSHGWEVPSLGLIKSSLELEKGMGCGESVSRKLGEEESCFAWIRLHPGFTTRRLESHWHLMRVYCSHPACQSNHWNVLECYFSGICNLCL